ncbi:hypothetical protein CNA03065 [Cryptococcus deneoformans JEC21]|uniref:CTLH domain-containing protein n=1 Tax=Cryptococcus deneoformans (strain JEC21 / ATCC MYA-565) TaxID=214684 RepID=A0A0S2LIM1_CRYD1|nr:hypothetical protein CNA03065 [Cryptococcus neoformans var. neoformans JEC21]ALO60316.1 hypothetical protein CNA03065 [Cryptococcus neoformans var. neoformans JEC21]
MHPHHTPLLSLHQVVLDYVITNAYASTAKSLSQSCASGRGASPSGDTAMPSDLKTGSKSDANGDQKTNGEADGMDVDVEMDGSDDNANSGEDSNKNLDRGPALDEQALDMIERRREILEYILSGSIDKAVELLDRHFPLVLSCSEPMPSNYGAATNGATSNGTATPKSRLSSSGGPLHSESSINHSVPVLNSSVHPDHIRLNLQIQRFIESFRQMNPSSPSSPSSSTSSPANSQTFNGGSGVTLTHALSAAHGLHSEAKKLPAEVRAIYLQEIKDVGALFAYENAEMSPLKGFLEQSRRVKLAEQVNKAILRSEGRAPQSQLEEYSKRLEVYYKVLEGNEIDPTPPWTAKDGLAKEHLAAYWKYHDIKNFNLHDFASLSW